MSHSSFKLKEGETGRETEREKETQEETVIQNDILRGTNRGTFVSSIAWDDGLYGKIVCFDGHWANNLNSMINIRKQQADLWGASN